MKKVKWIIAAAAAILIIACSVIFYRTVFIDEGHQDFESFAENLELPDGITMIDKVDRPKLPDSNLREGEIEIFDKVVTKTILIEIGKSELEKATKRDMKEIDDNDRAFSIGAIYMQETQESDRLLTIEVLKDGTFIASKNSKGRQYYAKGKFGIYTMNYFTGLYTYGK